jgi:D-alanine-D-alanine ligase
VPAILEMMNIPYSGSGVLSQAVALNKSRKKEILSYYNIPTPKYQLFKRNGEKLKPDLKFPLIVKPDAEGSSIGITNDAVVYDVEALKKQVNYVLKNYNQNALVEEYCEGLEFTVSILGNNKPRVLPIVEINFSHLPGNLNKIDSWEAKWIYDRPDSPVDALVCPANIKPKLKTLIEKIAKQAFGILECKDFSRIDMRLDANGIPQILDVNTLPGLTPDYKYNSRFIRSCYTAGMTYDQIIMEILNNALKRYNLYLPKLKDIS